MSKPTRSLRRSVSAAAIDNSSGVARGSQTARASVDDWQPLLLVRASAGTGKTYRLTGRLLNLLFRGAAIESLLATTFTRKAAGEILERVLTSLARAATDPTAQSLQQLRQQTGRSEITQKQCVRLLHLLIRELHRLRIGTLDSLFSQLARSFPFELGLPPGWRLTDESEEVWLRQRAINTLLASADPQQTQSLLSMLSKGEVKRSVAREIEAVVGGAYGISRNCPTEAWGTLGVPTGPDNAQLTQAAGVLLNAEMGHKSADKILQAIGQLLQQRAPEELAGYGPVVSAQRWSADVSTATYYRKPVPPVLIGALQVAFEYARSWYLGLLDQQSKATGELLSLYEQSIVQIKQSARALGFDDVSIRLATWVSGQSIGVLGARLDGTVRHVLLDEFQDTSPHQWAVLRPLADHAAKLAAGDQSTVPSDAEGCVSNDMAGSFFCVGDTKQAIYGWRGGVAAIFDAVDQQVSGVVQHSMSESFRSSPVIMQVVTDLFQNLTRHDLTKQAGTRHQQPENAEAYEADALVDFAKSFPQHEAHHPQLPGFVTLRTVPASDGDATERKVNAQAYVADQITQLSECASQRSIGVLTRSNQTVGRLIYMLQKRGVSVSQEGGNPLTDSGAVELLLSALMLAEHPGDGRWWYHIRHSPLAHAPLFQGLRGAEEGLLAASAVRGLVQREGLVWALRAMGDSLAPHCDAADSLRMRQLLGLAQQFEHNPQPRLRDFVELVQLQRVEKPQPAQVRVMTIHQAKGLEFDAVVLPELEWALGARAIRCVPRRPSPCDAPEAMLRFIGKQQWGFLPRNWQQAFGQSAYQAVSESLCLLYVAVTRPRYGLYMYVQPTTKADKPTLGQKNAKMLLYAALGCDGDPRESPCPWFSQGAEDWYNQLPALPPDPPAPVKKVVRLQPTPATPRRNGTGWQATRDC